MARTQVSHRARSARRRDDSSKHVADELFGFDKYLRDVRGLGEGTRDRHRRIVGALLHQKFVRPPVDIAQLHRADVRRFMARQRKAESSPSYLASLGAALRSYFRYRTICGDSTTELVGAIATPVHWKLASLPRALGTDDVDRLLGPLPLRRWPKRFHAIVRCALDLGLRAGEVARLAIGDIDWREGTVTLRHTKSGRCDVLPLPISTGQALADYIQYERPSSADPAVFLRRLGTNEVSITPTAVAKLLARACQRVGLPGTSGHALRHTVACRLVERGSSLKEVADVLRHRSLETTRIYAKLDTPALACVALAWPGSSS